MRIAVVTDLLRENGAGVMALAAADLLDDAGHEVVLIGGAMQAALARSLDTKFLAAVSFTQDEATLGASVTESDHQSLLRAFRAWFDRQLDEYAIDLVYVHNCGRIFDQVDLADLSRRLPVMHTMHDELFFTDSHYTFRSPTGETIRTYEPRNDSAVFAHQYAHLFDVANRAGNFLGIGPSRWLTDRAQRVFPNLEFTHIPNGVDPNIFAMQERSAARHTLGLPTERPIVLFVGNPTQVRKGFHIYEAALRTLQREDDTGPIRFVVGGNGTVATGGIESALHDGPIMNRLQHSTANPVKDLGLDGPAIVVADLDRALMPAVYGAADVLVHPSLIDNLPTVPIEAGLCGTRCLATNVGGTAETIADTNDLFEPDIEAEVLGQRIAEALDAAASESSGDRDSRRARQLERFSPDVHRLAILEALEQLMASVGSHG